MGHRWIGAWVRLMGRWFRACTRAMDGRIRGYYSGGSGQSGSGAGTGVLVNRAKVCKASHRSGGGELHLYIRV